MPNLFGLDVFCFLGLLCESEAVKLLHLEAEVLNKGTLEGFYEG